MLPGGLEIQDYCKVARALAEAGLDIIHVSAGTYQVMERRIPPMYLASETFAGYAQAIRQAARLPVIASGTIHDPTEANRLIAGGEADFVSLARPLFADPALPNKLLRDRPQEVLPCIRCNTCLAREQGGARGYCAVNPKTGREYEPQAPPGRIKTIGIIGAGPAGIQTALSAAERGHRVTLWEKNDRIGGQLLLASRLPFKSTLVRLLDYYEAALERANVVVRCGEIARPDQIEADVVVLASGPIWDDLGSVAHDATIPMITAAEAFTRLDTIEGRVLVVGAGLTGAELAWALSSRAREVILAERDDDYDDDVNLIAKIVLARELAKGGVDLQFNTEVAGVTGRMARIIQGGVAREREVDLIVSTIRRPGPLVDALPVSTGRSSQPIVVGENAGKRGLLEATLSAYRAASSL